MEGEANLPVPSAIPNKFNCPDNPNTSLYFSSSHPEFLRDVQAAFKRHRPLRTTLSTRIMPKRVLVPQNEIPESSASQCGIEVKKPQPNISINHGHPVKNLTIQTNSTKPIVGETQEDESITPPSNVGTFTEGFNERLDSLVVQGDESERASRCLDKTSISSLHGGSQQVKGQKMLHFSSGHHNTSQEMDWITSGNQGETSVILNEDESNNQKFQDARSDVNLRFNGGHSSMSHGLPIGEDGLPTFKNFLSKPLTQSSAGGTSCVTTTSVHTASAPMRNSTTSVHSASCRDGSTLATIETLGSLKGDSNRPHSSHKEINGVVTSKTLPAGQVQDSGDSTKSKVMQCINGNDGKTTLPQEISFSKCSSLLDNKLTETEELVDGGASMQSQSISCKDLPSGVKLDSSRSGKQEKVDGTKTAPHKINYDPKLFFKVNGKLYQKLGKIGSGGSSEVHKVISSDCTIYALKKIRLKGRDYSTAYGFCQEIVYLNKLKGKNNIINLIDYEVTDRTLLEEVMNGCTSNKDAKVNDNAYIYMLLEYGEIDLAHMLSQKWKEIDRSSSIHTIEENWLRFYWQQILQAVNTIHEERIVHSDLKPANFLLVKGSLKLIDFGIAKVILSDTTHIQRDSQAGTLSYMSPEAYMCNERDANGNMIKCGRPSDIWSLGCILYQMVYGRTPFAEYKNFWAKLKVITDPTHEIKYEAVSNPWLLDLMRKCLAWDRHERWRIPQLLQHPFLVPPVLPQIPLSHDHISNLFRYIAETCKTEEEALSLCSRFQELR